MRRVLHSAAVALGLALAGAADAGPDQDYMLYCMGCHGSEAQGLPGKIPPLAGSLARFMSTPDGRDYVLRVPGAASSALSDAQLAAVLNWLVMRYSAAEERPPASFTALTAMHHDTPGVRRTPLANVKERRREVIRGLAASGVAPPAEY